MVFLISLLQIPSDVATAGENPLQITWDTFKSISVDLKINMSSMAVAIPATLKTLCPKDSDATFPLVTSKSQAARPAAGEGPLHTYCPHSCCTNSPSAHPGVELDAGAVLCNERPTVVCHICHATQAAGVIHGPVVGASLVLVLESRQLDGLDIHAGVHKLPNPEPGGKAGDETQTQTGSSCCELGKPNPRDKTQTVPQRAV